MTITKDQQGSTLTIKLDGRLDTTTAPQLEGELKSSLDGITELIFDLSSLAYISSAGLRVLLSAQKVMNKQGSMVVRGANEDLMEIFDVTGFVDILNIES
ncbi:MAG: STAS domain-containing protein [Lachnospiraceae bacterium]|nr:STAS domain-containing protein [Lachnospiraceae bacterium]